MKNKKGNNRRQFLRNTSIATLGLGLISKSTAVAASARVKSTLMCEPTTLDYYGEGPFYTENPPDLVNGQLATSDAVGERMIISGRVYDLSCEGYISDTIIDVWHADNNGEYDNQAYNFRGQTLTNSQGFYMFETIKPGKYNVGSSFRPAHIHFKITPPDRPTLITQLYFEDDEDIASDPAASLTSGEFDASHRIIPLTLNSENVLEGTWDIVIDGMSTTSLNDIHLDKGMIYKIFPNPFVEKLTIQYGVFRPSKVSLSVYDLQGRLVANLEEQTLTPDKYEAVWSPDAALPNGHYFITLKVNDLQVHYLKVLRQQ